MSRFGLLSVIIGISMWVTL